MDLVDEEDDVASVFHFVDHRFEPIFELASILRTGHQARHIQSDHSLVLQAQRHLFVDDALCQTFDDSGFTHARLTQQDRVVFRFTDQDLHHSMDLFISADHWIELPVGCFFGQIDPIFFQSFQCLVGSLGLDLLAASDRLEGLFELEKIHIFAKDLFEYRMIRIGFDPCIHGQKFISVFDHQPFGFLQTLGQSSGDLYILFCNTRYLWQSIHIALDLKLDGGLVYTHLVEGLVEDRASIGQQRP